MNETAFICIFCGSSIGSRPAYAEAARRVGSAFARHGLGLVYGGGRVGLMGVVADTILSSGGQVVGIIPEGLATKEIAHHGVTELHVVGGMHERKALMAQKSSAFLTLPGGIGTFEEFFEVLSWAALGLHRKPLGILNVEGYFDPLLTLLDHATAERFLHPQWIQSLLVSDNPENLVAALVHRPPSPPVPRWLKLEET
jgi:uncharacterized protein (TIGR00730 family)